MVVGLVPWHLSDVARWPDAQRLEGEGSVAGEVGTGEVAAGVEADFGRSQLDQVLEEVVVANLRFHRGSDYR